MSILPVYDLITIPDSTLFYRTELYEKMTGKKPVQDEKVTVIVAKEEMTISDISSESVYPIGVTGYIKEVNTQGFILISLICRVKIDSISVTDEGQILLQSSHLPDVEDMDAAEAEERTEKVKEEFRKLSREFEWGPVINLFLHSWKTLGDIGSASSPWMNLPNDRFYALLAEDSRRRRFDDLENMLYEYVELSRVRAKARSDQKQSQQKLYKEQALRNQIEYLQKELDEMHPDELNGIRKLEIKIQESGMNETARKEADKLISRLKAEGQDSHEYGLLTDYLEFLASLPWKKERFRKIDLDAAEKVLDADHFGLEKVKKRILEQIAVMQLKKKQSGSIILFVGAPGTGKTSIGQSIAKALKREYIRISLGGVRDEADIRGHRRTYVGAMPGRIMDGIQKSGVSNPVMVLDEVDKLSVSYNGDPASALLEVLDPEQNSTFTDHYLNVPYDLSDVLFICTANTAETIPEPLLNRMEVIQFQGYTPIEKEQIALRHLLPRAIEAAGLTPKDITVSDSIVRHIISEYTREAGVRGLKKRIDTLCRSAAVQLVKGADSPVVITEDLLRDYLDMSPIRQKNVRDEAAPGVVTGLAWTSAGGDVLYIETTKMKGSGRLTITGQLGDVMKESVQIALSLVRTIYAGKIEDIEKEDIHIHVPDGATPKDGPSAGITITTALASLFTGVPVSPAVAMTGEVSLQGSVNPIGGLPEKLMAAQRAGVKKVFIPAENEDDLRDVAAEVKEQLEIVPVRTVEDVLTSLSLL